MEKITLTITLDDGVKEWLEAEGDVLYRSGPKQAAFLCAEYLNRIYKAARRASKNGTASTHHEVGERQS